MSSAARHRPTMAILATVALVASIVPLGPVRGDTPPGHLVVSEIVTGGSSASDELIELYNPSPVALPLEGLELVYVTSTGTTISRRAAWALGAPAVPAGGHVLVANAGGMYAGIADATYASGIAATGGSVAIRIQGAATAIDAVGWGATTSTWREGTPAPAPPTSGSIERRPGGTAGSSVDTDDNRADFVVRELPDPQNLGSPPTPDPGLATPTPAATASTDPTEDPSGDPAPSTQPTPTPPSPTALPTPGRDVLTIAAARALPDGAEVTVAGVALAGSDFTDGGGTVVDATAGIAVLVDGGSYARGDRLVLRGTVDDRYSQRTLRVSAADVEVVGTGPDPSPTAVATGSIGEATEGRLVRLSGAVLGAPTALTTGLAFDVDDGSGPIRVLVATPTGIDLTTWKPGATVTVVGLAGQRDSSGSGTSGYRVLPRDSGDVVEVRPPTEPTRTPGASASAGPSGSAGPSQAPAGVTTIAAARELPKNARVRVRGTVTLPTGLVDEATAVVQDATGAIVLRLGDEAGTLALGAVVEVDGARSTKGGMETLRVSEPPRHLGAGSGPIPRVTRTGDAADAIEARLVTVRGALRASARRASTGSVSFEVDDGSGPIRIAVPAALGLDDDPFVAGAWAEVTGVLGQETTGSQPQRGYRIWPRTDSDLRLTLPTGTTEGGSGGGPAGGGTASSGGATFGGLGELDGGGPVDGAIGATIVHGPWPELGVGGILWDGERVVAIAAVDGSRVSALLASHGTPLAVALEDPVSAGTATYGLPLLRLGPNADDLAPARSSAVAPATSLPGETGSPRWVALVGRHVATSDGHRLLVDRSAGFELEPRCAADDRWPLGTVAVEGIAIPASDADVVVPCGGMLRAPALRNAVAAHAVVAPAVRQAGASAAGSEPPARGSGAAALLLALAAIGLAGSAGLAWHRRDRDGASPEPDDDAALVPPNAGHAADAPVLTLVPLPRERAP